MSSINTQEKVNFGEGSIRKWVIKMGIPGLIMMFTFGLYTFADSILSVQFAPSAYDNDVAFQAIISSSNGAVTSKDLVRGMMGPTATIVNIIGAIAIFFAQGTATRQAINLGRGQINKANNNVRVGFIYSIITSIIMMPILISISNPWISSQMGSMSILSKYSSEYANIIVFAMPFIILNQLFTFMLRNEGANKAIMIGAILPIPLNLILDWVFMDQFNMGIKGGAWATFSSHLFTFTILIFFAWKIKSEYVRPKILFGFKMKHISLVGIALVGMAPFLSNMAFAITQTFANRNALAVSEVVYGNDQQIYLMSAGVWPIFMLAFPTMFGFVQGITPVAAYNYGKKNYERVKQTVKWTTIYAFIIATIIYLIIGVGLGNILLQQLGIESKNKVLAYRAVLIALLAMFPFAFTNGAMIFFGSTDRVWRNLYSNISFGIIWYIPMLFIVKAIAIANPQFEYWYWFTWFFTSLGSILILIPLLLHGIKNLEKSTKSLDEIVLNIENRILSMFKRKS